MFYRYTRVVCKSLFSGSVMYLQYIIYIVLTGSMGTTEGGVPSCEREALLHTPGDQTVVFVIIFRTTHLYLHFFNTCVVFFYCMFIFFFFNSTFTCATSVIREKNNYYFCSTAIRIVAFQINDDDTSPTFIDICDCLFVHGVRNVGNNYKNILSTLCVDVK